MFKDAAEKDLLLCSAIGFALFVAGALLPFLALPVMLIYPFPLILLSFERGPLLALLSGAATALAVYFVFSPSMSVIYFLAFGLPGALLGFAAKRTTGPDMVLFGVICSLSCKLAAAFLIYWLTGVNFLSPETREIEQALFAFAESRVAALSAGDIPALKNNLSDAVSYIVMLIPFSLILFTAAEVMLSYYLSNRLHRLRSGENFFQLPRFERWSFPRNILAALVVGFICERIGNTNPDLYVLRQVGANVSALARALFIVQGLAVACFFMNVRGFPKAANIVIIVITPLVSILGDIFSVVGIVDIGVDLRKRARGKQR
jgi:uncharacterized protein YybS (DUF2232 family)